ncbi:MAG: ribosome recycling factor [Pseudomonadota bacterium]|jgi:ribosome recycling factor|nr:ribosome recycling factor [Pseudomonadota bacterium]MEC9045751.1 ribosome recycling factor [Pseudomonadota bacterium]MED5225753.1 ribosome recycling factor [Pseudomonadota bacterium]MED5473987.1 ribosome recycling factor [Pseudomonadota bacterium]|tara:strand:- start:326 stop:883 length:558 start_codon:yes stop_codon:yes gene_type:complete
MDDIDIDDLQRRMEGAINSLTKDFQGLRTGRANTQLLDSILVEVYGATMPVNQVATVSVPEPRMLSVQVWDKDNVKLVEKAIRESELGLNPQLDGQLLRIPLPDLSEDRRIELSKVAAKYAENAKIAVRNVRRDGMDKLKKMEKDGNLSQDDKRLYDEEIQSLTDRSVVQIDELFSKKEEEIMQV